jgi:hypothetical protein
VARANPQALARRRRRYKGTVGNAGPGPNAGPGQQQVIPGLQAFMGNLPEWLDAPTFQTYDTPPMGSFDPGLLAEVRASQRGLEQLIEDSAQEAFRSRRDLRTEDRLQTRDLRRNLGDLRTDLRQNVRDTRTDRRRGLQDIRLRRGDERIDFTRRLGDLAIARQRGDQDYARVLTDMQRDYAARAQDQAQRAARQGVLGDTGSMAASDAVRATNQAYEREAVDTERMRDLQDLARDEGMTRQDFARTMQRLGLSEGRLRRDAGTALSRYRNEAGRNRRRMRQDFRTTNMLDRREFRDEGMERHEQLSRARLEQLMFGQDATEQMYFQAHQTNPDIRFPTGDNAPWLNPQNEGGNGRGGGAGGNGPRGMGIGTGENVGQPRQTRGWQPQRPQAPGPRNLLANRRRPLATRRRPLIRPRY